MTSGEAFEAVRSFIDAERSDLVGELWSIDFNFGCPVAEEDHEEDPRYYAHTFCALHPKGDTICVARAFEELDDRFKVGILLHEFGHLFGGHSDADADWWVEEELGIDIHYDPETTVQYVSPEDIL